MRANPDSWKKQWIASYKKEKNKYISFRAFYISKILEVYIFDAVIQDTKYHEASIDATINRLIKDADKKFDAFADINGTCVVCTCFFCYCVSLHVHKLCLDILIC